MSNLNAMAMKMAAKMAKAKEPEKVQAPVVHHGPEIPMAIRTESATIAVYGTHFVSKRDVELIGLSFDPIVLETAKDHGVRLIRFLANGRPVKEDGAKILANCSPDLGGILINLEYHFDRACELSVEDANRSVWYTFNWLMLQSYLHEICHISMRQNEETRKEMEEIGLEEEEKQAEAWSNAGIIKLAKKINIEPAHYSDSPFFCQKWNEVKALATADDPWFSKQQHMLDNHISYKLEPEEHNGQRFEGLVLNSMRQFIQLQSPDGDSSEEWDMPVANTTSLDAAIATAAHGTEAQPAKEYVVNRPETPAPVNGVFVAPAPVNTGEPVYEHMHLFGQPGTSVSAEEVNGFSNGDIDEFGNFIGGGQNDMSPNYAAGEQLFDNNGFSTAEGFAAAAGAELFPIGSSVGATNPNPTHYNRELGNAAGQQPIQVYPQTGLSPEQTAQIVNGLYMKIYNHIFSQCGRLLNSDIAFQRPEAVAMVPIQLTEDEKKVVVKMECMDQNGQLHRNMPITDGLLRGYVSSKAKLPMYKLYINNNGVEAVRAIMPQNTAKKSGTGELSRYAVEARNGSCIMYVVEGNDAISKAGGKHWLFKVTNGQWEAL